jgi:two-component system LytT family response regulator/two-component system response regulator AlgR
MDPLRVAVAEDEPLNRARLVRLLEEAGCDVAGAFENGSALSSWLLEHPQEVDALFLDIRMPGPSGLDLAAELEAGPAIVFVTAHADHAVQAFEAAAVDYLLKPVRAERLAQCLARLRQRVPGRARPGKPTLRFAIKAGSGVLFVDLGKTSHFEVEDEVVYAHAGGRLQTLWRTLAEVEAAFPEAGLMRIHRHLLVRPAAILGLKPIEGGRVRVSLPGGIELDASRPMTPRLKARLGLA